MSNRKGLQLSDKERMLLYLVGRLGLEVAFINGRRISDPEGFHVSLDKAKPGEIAIAGSSFHEPNPFVVAKIVHANPNSEWLVQELGSNRTCKYTNETFYPIRNLPPGIFLMGKERKFYELVRKAFRKVFFRFNSLDFSGETAILIYRPGSFSKNYRCLKLNWHKIRSIKTLCALLEPDDQREVCHEKVK